MVLMAYISATTGFQQIIFILKFKHYQMNVARSAKPLDAGWYGAEVVCLRPL